jgi:lysylphosphatidylglycerol synthetase-like protein (DUF2156 family)
MIKYDHFFYLTDRMTAALHGPWRDYMIEVFAIQLLAAALGAVSTAAADWLYQRALIGRRLHNFWVAVSIAVICLPVFAWTSVIFLGPGLAGQLAAGALILAIFLWVYGNLPKLPSVQRLGPRLPPRHPSSGAVPPASKLSR